jgi:hypothetical protein
VVGTEMMVCRRCKQGLKGVRSVLDLETLRAQGERVGVRSMR